MFRKKPVVIEAVQLTWKTWNDVCAHLGDIISPTNPARSSEDYSDTCGEIGPYIELTIPTLEGAHIAKHGDWIIKGVKGEFYPCKPDIFAATYEPADMVPRTSSAVAEALGLFASAIKSGEPWTASCETAMARARDELAGRTTQPDNQQSAP